MKSLLSATTQIVLGRVFPELWVGFVTVLFLTIRLVESECVHIAYIHIALVRGQARLRRLSRACLFKTDSGVVLSFLVLTQEGPE